MELNEGAGPVRCEREFFLRPRDAANQFTNSPSHSTTRVGEGLSQYCSFNAPIYLWERFHRDGTSRQESRWNRSHSLNRTVLGLDTRTALRCAVEPAPTRPLAGDRECERVTHVGSHPRAQSGLRLHGPRGEAWDKFDVSSLSP